ncbi:MAG: DNA polymerase III subunit delta [Planctomycetota bacterium]
MSKPDTPPPVVVVFGDEEYQKTMTIERTLNALLPPEVDRALALCIYDGAQNEEQGGPSYAAVHDDLATMPFLAPRRVVLIREADSFITRARDKLEKYLAAPAPTSTLVLECRSFPRNTRLYKLVTACGGEAHECRKLAGPALAGFVLSEAQARRKRIEPAAAARLCDLIGQDQGWLASEVEKLSLYIGQRATITLEDVDALVGLSREEKIFAAVDAAGAGDARRALSLWHQVLATDTAAVYKVIGGVAYVLRRWLKAHQMSAEGLSVHQIAPKVMMWKRERQLETILRRVPARRVGQLLAAAAELDSQAKSGIRSIDIGVDALLLKVAAPAT